MRVKIQAVYSLAVLQAGSASAGLFGKKKTWRWISRINTSNLFSGNSLSVLGLCPQTLQGALYLLITRHTVGTCSRGSRSYSGWFHFWGGRTALKRSMETAPPALITLGQDTRECFWRVSKDLELQREAWNFWCSDTAEEDLPVLHQAGALPPVCKQRPQHWATSLETGLSLPKLASSNYPLKMSQSRSYTSSKSSHLAKPAPFILFGPRC